MRLTAMTELRNVEADLSRFRARVLVASLVVLGAFLLLASRLVYLQVYRHADLSEQAESNRTAIPSCLRSASLTISRPHFRPAERRPVSTMRRTRVASGG